MYQLKPEIELSWINEEVILQNMTTGDVHMLNNTASLILKFLLENKSGDNIAGLLQEKYNDADGENVIADVNELIKTLSEKDIFVTRED